MEEDEIVVWIVGMTDNLSYWKILDADMHLSYCDILLVGFRGNGCDG